MRSATRCSRSRASRPGDPELLKKAPHGRPVKRLDEVRAAKQPVVKYGFDKHQAAETGDRQPVAVGAPKGA